MAYPLNLVTIHHEGAGDLTDVPRGAAGGYTYWLGVSGFTRLRDPRTSYATLHYNHVSIDICLSGNRDNWDVTSDDLKRLCAIACDARARGDLTANPTVRPHRWTFNTDCPGQRTMGVWDAITKQFCGPVPVPTPPSPAPHPKHPTLNAGDFGHDVCVLQHELNVGASQHLKEDGAFGPQTLQAVYGFQAFFKLTHDGIVGPQTWTMLDYCFALRSQ